MAGPGLRQSVVGGISIAFLGVFIALSDQAIPVATGADSTHSECVILLHGLARSPRSMRKLAHALKDDYRVINQGYPSRNTPLKSSPRSLSRPRWNNVAQIEPFTLSHIRWGEFWCDNICIQSRLRSLATQ